MAWRVEVDLRAARALRKLDRTIAARIVGYLEEAVASDPRARGKALVGELGGFWRYRVGDWRVTCRIEDARLVVLVIEVGHRREVYR